MRALPRRVWCRAMVKHFYGKPKVRRCRMSGLLIDGYCCHHLGRLR